MKLQVSLDSSSYPITIERGILSHLEGLDPARRYAIVTDDGVPAKWVQQVCDQLPDAFVITIAQGEGSKCFLSYEQVLQQMADHGMTRKDAVIAVGGGVPGDLAGFAAATYMRGIDFYNIPTTLLSQVDSSVGGKTAIDLGALKNIVGAFWQPRAVWIDPDVLSTLDERQLHAGLAEALKMGLLFEPSLVDAFEAEELDLPYIISRSIDLKRQVVEQDEKESGLRKSLNFGHTIGHAIEGSYNLSDYLHGECVSMGMLYFLPDPALKERVLRIYDRLNLPVIPDFGAGHVLELLRHDKKGAHDGVDCVVVEAPGQFVTVHKSFDELEELLACPKPDASRQLSEKEAE